MVSLAANRNIFSGFDLAQVVDLKPFQLVGLKLPHGKTIGDPFNVTGIVDMPHQVHIAVFCLDREGFLDTLWQNEAFGELLDGKIPAIDELDSMYVHKDTIGGFQSGWYWSSTEHDNVGAWIYMFDLNEPAWTAKGYAFINVRCIRKF